jgi:hypothetical protein
MQMLILLIFAAIVAIIASSKGRSPIGWFFIGFFTNIIGLILILVLSDLKEEQAQRMRVEQENRRLREQLRQERLKQESFREYAQRRLDVHDDQLGVDTRTLTALPQPEPLPLAPANGQEGQANGQERQPQSPVQPANAPFPRPIAWYYERNGETRGPVAGETIRQMLVDGELRSATLVWAEHLKDWIPAAEAPEFRGLAAT